MKNLTLLLLSILFLTTVSAVIINEVEINPLEGSSGREWIELYNDGENDSDISGWEIWEGLSKLKKILTIPNETIIQKGNFYVIELNNARTLNNDGDFVILNNSEVIEIDKTPVLNETSSSSKTWQLCDGEWVFLDSTKDDENNCPEESNQEEVNTSGTEEDDETAATEEPNEEAISETKNVTIKKSSSPTNIQLQEINLNPQAIKSGENSEVLDKGNYAIYGLLAFGVLLGLLFLIKNFVKKRINENEFT